MSYVTIVKKSYEYIYTHTHTRTIQMQIFATCKSEINVDIAHSHENLMDYYICAVKTHLLELKYPT